MHQDAILPRTIRGFMDFFMFSLDWKAPIRVGALELRRCPPEIMVLLAIHPT